MVFKKKYEIFLQIYSVFNVRSLPQQRKVQGSSSLQPHSLSSVLQVSQVFTTCNSSPQDSQTYVCPTSMFSQLSGIASHLSMLWVRFLVRVPLKRPSLLE